MIAFLNSQILYLEGSVTEKLNNLETFVQLSENLGISNELVSALFLPSVIMLRDQIKNIQMY